VFVIVSDFQLIPTHFIRFWRVLQEDLRAIIRVSFQPNAQVFCKFCKISSKKSNFERFLSDFEQKSTVFCKF